MKTAQYHIDRILSCGEDIASFVAGLDAEAFRGDKRSYNAVLMALTVIGEEAGKLQRQFPQEAAARSEVPWSRLIAMRNVIAHQYFAVDSDVVWEAAVTHVPLLMDQLRRPVAG